MLPGAGNEKFRVRGRVRSKNENDSGGPSERKPRPRRGSFLLARNRSSIVLVLVLVLVLVSAIGCKSEDVGVPKYNKLALMGFNPGNRILPAKSPEGTPDRTRNAPISRTVISRAPSASGQIPLTQCFPRLNPGLSPIAPSSGQQIVPKSSLTLRHSA
jgi:hypothetical protein